MKDIANATTPIELWFDFASPYSYLSIMRIEPLAQARGARILWRPFLLGPIFRALGWSSSPFVQQSEKGAYMWRDVDRQCRKYGLPWKRPSEFPRRGLLPTRMALLCAYEPWIGEFCRRIMRFNFVEDRPIESAQSVAEALAGLAPDACRLLAAAEAEATKLQLRNQTEAARRQGIFGAPTFCVGSELELFWGDDRLEDALAHAAAGGPPSRGTELGLSS